METTDSSESIFLHAEALCKEGKREEAALLLSQLVCSAKEESVRKRAGQLFVACKKELPIPMTAPKNPVPQNPLPFINGPTPTKAPQAARSTNIHKPQADTTLHHGNTSIPRSAALPQSLLPFLIKYLKLSKILPKGVHSFPESITTTIQEVEIRLRQLATDFTQANIQELLEGYAPLLREIPLGADVFAALVNTLYAKDFLSNEGARKLSLLNGETSSNGRTIRELLLADE